jgi:pilus assembly protein Flp/PilA
MPNPAARWTTSTEHRANGTGHPIGREAEDNGFQQLSFVVCREESAMLSLVSFVQTWFANLETEEEGQGLVEYALIIVLIAIVCIVALTALGGRVSEVFDEITAGLSPA